MSKKKLISKESVPSSLHPILKKKLAYSITKSGMFLRSLLEDTLLKYKLQPPQAGILHILKCKEIYNQLLLGQEMGIDKASMVKFIDGLEKQGFVRRITDPNDRRAKIIELTPKGKKVQKEIFDNHCNLEKELLKSFTQKEVNVLNELMPRLLDAVWEKLKTKKKK